MTDPTSTDPARPIYKICPADAWAEAVREGVYRGSADDVRDGFIHFSEAHQVARTAAKFFAGRTDLVLVTVDPSSLGAALRYEVAGSGDLFPHLYAALVPALAREVVALPWDGVAHRLPAAVGKP